MSNPTLPELLLAIPRTNTTTRDQRAYLIEALGRPLNINIKYNPYDGRTLLSVFNRNGPFNDDSQPFIGCILDLTDEKSVERGENAKYPIMENAPMPRVIAMVPTPPIDKYNIDEVLTAKDIKVLPINDGTTITMYYYQNRWVYSTISSYDFGPMPWSSTPKVTHDDIINEVFNECKFDTAKLDTSKCYTIGFKGSTHPFLEGKTEPIYRMWFIQSVDLVGLNNAFADGKTPDRDEFTSFVGGAEIGLADQDEVKVDTTELINLNNAAYDNFVTTGAVMYGYIVKSGKWSYMINSSLYRYVRQMFYVAPVPGSRADKRRGQHQVNMYPIDRQKFCILHAILGQRHAEVFPKLFPQFTTEVKMIETTLAKIYSEFTGVYKKYITDTKLSAVPIPISQVRTHNNRTAKIGVRPQYSQLWDVMIRKIPRTKSTESARDIVLTYLVNQNNAVYIYPIVFDSNP